ncbi:hypothetical protein OJ996_23775 [Luteolibacter sp. GHJ8]|uniref:Lipoprotein n=1 Tax=Luteolibacter rhizosphaerae TaxID=2989719 RepID=A0ABT3G9V3_9BACT|nr:hypothetical protein [Luteolibacter rhizosphaerae]MCW1916627.1 hypothetical protein [Luteolibacter rhizosphaerae]
MKIRTCLVLSALALSSCDKGGEAAGGEAAKAGPKKSSSALPKLTEAESKEPAREGKSGEREAKPKRPPVATPAVGQPGKVISPFSGEIVDVGGKSKGELVEDPKYPGDASKQFEVPEMKETIPEAQVVPGKPGYVMSPYNNKVVDVRGIPAGRLVADPTFPAAERKHFRIPAGVEEDGNASLPENIDVPQDSAPPEE